MVEEMVVMMVVVMAMMAVVMMVVMMAVMVVAMAVLTVMVTMVGMVTRTVTDLLRLIRLQPTTGAMTLLLVNEAFLSLLPWQRVLGEHMLTELDRLRPRAHHQQSLLIYLHHCQLNI